MSKIGAKFWLRLFLILSIIGVSIFFLFKEEIKENKIYKTKMDALNVILEAESPSEATEQIMEIIDSNFRKEAPNENSIQ